MVGLGAGFPGTVLPDVDITKDTIAVGGERAKQAPKIDPIKLEFQEYTGRTGGIAMKFQEDSFSLDNPEMQKVVQAQLSGDPMANILMNQYVAKVNADAKNIEALGTNAAEIYEAAQGEGYDFPYNQDMVTGVFGLMTSIDNSRPAYYKDGELMFRRIDGSEIAAREVEDIFFATKKNLVSAQDFDKAVVALTPATISYARTTERPGAGPDGRDIVQMNSGEYLDLDKARANQALLFSKNISADDLNPDGSFKDDMMYNISDYAASGLAQYIPRGVEPFMLRGEPVSGKELNVLLDRAVDLIKTRVGVTSSSSTRYEGGDGGPGAANRRAGRVVQLKENDTPVIYGGSPVIQNAKPFLIGEYRGQMTGPNKDERTFRRYVIAEAVVKKGDNYEVVADVVEIPETDIAAIAGGNPASLTDDQLMTLIERGKNQYYKEGHKMSNKEANQYRASLGYKTNKDWHEANRKMANEVRPQEDPLQ